MKEYEISVLRRTFLPESVTKEHGEEIYVAQLRNLTDHTQCHNLCTPKDVGKWLLTVLANNIEWPAKIEVETDFIDIDLMAICGAVRIIV